MIPSKRAPRADVTAKYGPEIKDAALTMVGSLANGRTEHAAFNMSSACMLGMQVFWFTSKRAVHSLVERIGG
jgi:hypothetical protein